MSTIDTTNWKYEERRFVCRSCQKEDPADSVGVLECKAACIPERCPFFEPDEIERKPEWELSE